MSANASATPTRSPARAASASSPTSSSIRASRSSILGGPDRRRRRDPHREPVGPVEIAHLAVLALIRQESVFRPLAKSPAGARGLLQLTIDAAQKYASSAGLKEVQENDLYRPETAILIGGGYLAELARMFPDQLEAVAASYNGGEDNVARWVKRSKHQDPGSLRLR